MNKTGDVLLDTSIVIEYLRKQPEIHQRLQSATTLFLPIIALGELLYGAFKSRNAEKMTKEITEFCRGCVILSSDETTAGHYGRIKMQLALAGTPIPQNDIWIAAIAKDHQLPVTTKDRHFSLVEGLTVLTW